MFSENLKTLRKQKGILTRRIGRQASCRQTDDLQMGEEPLRSGCGYADPAG